MVMLYFSDSIMLTSIENLSHINGQTTNASSASSILTHVDVARNVVGTNTIKRSNSNDFANGTAVQTNGNKIAKAVLICHPNSHSFLDRSLILDKPIKIGRSVGHNKTSITNGIFDCKVLSRNHALLWFEDGKFLLRDTRSSNGTFVNTERLSKSSEESPPREVFSGDTVQFGVDVVENSRNVTHGCVIATLKLFLPNGREAKSLSVPFTTGEKNKVTLEDLYHLNQYLQESLQREQMLESKLSALQTVVKTLRESTELSWKALISNNSLLSRVELLEVQLKCYSKKFAEDKLREELRMLQEDKNAYEGVVKQYFQKILDEKIEAAQQCQDLNRALADTKTEFDNTQLTLVNYQSELRELALKNSKLEKDNEELELKVQVLEDTHKEKVQKLNDENTQLSNQVDSMSKSSEALQQTIKELETHGDYAHKQVMTLQGQVEDMQKHHSDILCELIDPAIIKDKATEADLINSLITIYTEALRKCQDKTVIIREQVEKLHAQKAAKQHEVVTLESDLNRCASELLNFKEEQAEIEAKIIERGGEIELYKPVPVILDELNEKKCVDTVLDLDEKKLLNVVQRDIKLTDSNVKELERLLKVAKDELTELTVSCAIEEDKYELAEKQLANVSAALYTLNANVPAIDAFQKQQQEENTTTSVSIEDVQSLKKQLSEAHDIAQEKQNVATKLISHFTGFADAIDTRLNAVESSLTEMQRDSAAGGAVLIDDDFVNELKSLKMESKRLACTVNEVQNALDGLSLLGDAIDYAEVEQPKMAVANVVAEKAVMVVENGRVAAMDEMILLRERLRSVVEEKKHLESEYAKLRQQYDCIESYPYFHLYISVPIIVLLFCIFNFGDKLSIVFGTNG